jgi:S1-C subfamily serine protease
VENTAVPLGAVAAVAVLFAAPSWPLRHAVAVPNVGWVQARPAGLGSGWVADADRRLMVTCRHVVGDQKTVEVFFPEVRDGALVSEKAAYLGNRVELRKAGRLVDGTVVYKSDATDLAVIRLDALPPGVRGLPLAKHDPSPGDPVCSVGHRGDLDTGWNLTTGHVRQTGRLADGYPWHGVTLAKAAGSVLLQLPIAEGDSGGPVLDRSGTVAAVVTAVRTRAPLATVGVSAAEVRAVLEPFSRDAKGSAGADALPFASRLNEIPARLAPATVWVRPAASDARTAGVLIGRRLVLTSHFGVGPADRVAVLFPLVKDGRVVGERDAYADPVGLRQRGNWQVGTVVGRDPVRDLALVRLDGVPAGAQPVPLAETDPVVGESVHAVSHPTGTEFAWCYSAGAVRQRGKAHVGPARDDDPKPVANVLQLPAQGTSAGGPVVDDQGELVGVLAVREGVQQQVGYAAAVGEVRAFLAEQPRWDLERFRAGLREWGHLPRLAALLWAAEADRLRKENKPSDTATDTALSLDPACVPALVVRGEARLAAGRTDDAAADFDAALAADPHGRAARWGRAEIALRRGEPKKAAAELARLLDPDPADAETHRRLAAALAAAGEDAKADAAFRNAVRLDPAQLRPIAADLLAAADATLQKAPDAPSRAADALSRGLSAAAGGLPAGAARTRLEAAVRRANGFADPKPRLAALREAAANLGR